MTAIRSPRIRPLTASAYNIYRVNLESVNSRVSRVTYDEYGTPSDPSDPSDDTVASKTIRDTALGIIFGALGRTALAVLRAGKPDTRGHGPHVVDCPNI